MVTQHRATGAIIVAVVLLIAMIATVLVNHPVRFPLDDAYITIANAEQLLTGAKDNYGQTRPTGATSLFHLLMLAGLGMVLDWTVASLVLSMIATALYVCGLYLSLRATCAHLLIVTLGTLTGFLGFKAWFQLMNGLETGWAMAAGAWAIYLSQYPEDRRRQCWLAALIGLLPFIRPELAILSALLVLSALLRLHRQPMRLARPALIALAAAGTMAALALAATGQNVPQTGGAKVAFFADAGLPLIDRFQILWGVLSATPLGLLLIGMVGLWLVRDGWVFVGFALIYLIASGISLPSGLMHNDQRYLYILVPMALMGWAALAARRDFLGGKSWPVIAACAALAIAGFWISGWSYYRRALNDTADQERLVAWARTHLPSDSRILVHDAGYVGWKTDFALIDVVGLKTPDSIAAHRRFTLPTVGRDRGLAIAYIAQQQRPTHAIIIDRPAWRDIAGYLRDAGWRLDPLRAHSGALYFLYRLTPPPEPKPLTTAKQKGRSLARPAPDIPIS